MINKKLISIVMGSQSDWKILSSCEKILNEFKIPYEKKNSFCTQNTRETL